MIMGLEPNSLDSNWDIGNAMIEHTKAEVDGTGQLPKKFLSGIHRKKTISGPFVNEPLSNRQAAGALIKIARGFGEDILITDYSYLSVPTIRIFIPNVCESFHFPGEDAFEGGRVLAETSELIYKGQAFTPLMLESLRKIMNYCAYTYSFNMQKVLGLITQDYVLLDYTYDPFKFMALLALHLKKYDIATENIRLSNKFSKLNERSAKLNELIFEAIAKGVTMERFMEYITVYEKREMIEETVAFYYNIWDNGLSIICDKCDSCEIYDNCKYPVWSAMNKKLEAKKEQWLAAPDNSDFTEFIQSIRKV